MSDAADLSDRDLVDALLAIETGLTDWELDFVESIDTWLDEHESLTDNQREVAERILEERGD